MMQFNQSEQCALMILFDLSQNPNQAIRVDDIARQHNLTKSLVKMALTSLKQRGLVVSKEGRGGGYRLAVLLNDISVSDVIGQISPDHLGLCNANDHRCIYDHQDCPIQVGWQKIAENLNLSLSQARVIDFIK